LIQPQPGGKVKKFLECCNVPVMFKVMIETIYVKQRIALILMSLAIAITSCSKQTTYDSNAELIGYDPRLCPSPCCGGLQITINNITYPPGAQFFLVYKLPASFSLGSNPKFPIGVKIDYTIDSTHCGKDYVDISRIEIK
jgi:hypothetical protein